MMTGTLWIDYSDTMVFFRGIYPGRKLQLPNQRAQMLVGFRFVETANRVV